MKRTLSKHVLFYLVLSFVIGLSILATNVFAQGVDATQTDAAQINPGQQMQNREDRVQERAVVREERKAALDKRMQDRLVNLSSNIIARLTAATNRMDNIISRLDTRIAKLDADGVDTTLAKTKLEEAKKHQQSATDLLQSLDSVQSAVSGDTPRESFQAIRSQFITIRDDIKQTRGTLKFTVTALKDAVKAAGTGTGASDAVSENPDNATKTDPTLAE